jgi:hypothetical protein
VKRGRRPERSDRTRRSGSLLFVLGFCVVGLVGLVGWLVGWLVGGVVVVCLYGLFMHRVCVCVYVLGCHIHTCISDRDIRTRHVDCPFETEAHRIARGGFTRVDEEEIVCVMRFDGFRACE